jgi:hypothetical protein
MNIYYRLNTGIKTPQDYNCDYFTIEWLGVNLRTGEAETTIHFWQVLADAEAVKPANASRNIKFPMGSSTDIAAGIIFILDMENVETTSLDFVSFKGAVIQ